MSVLRRLREGSSSNSASLAEKWGEAARLPQWRAPERHYPLRLISPASDKRISSTLGGLDGSAPVPVLRMNPKDAAARGLPHGARVQVFNDLGLVELRLSVTDTVPPGVVASEKGAWLRTSPTGQTISALVSAELRSDLADGACFNDTNVDVRAVLNN